MEKATHYFARQPIMDGTGETFGYEFFYRDNLGESKIGDPRSATASILEALLNQIGLQAGAGTHKVFINIDPSILQTDLLLVTPPERFVFALGADAVLGGKEREALKALHEQGYRFALEKVHPAPDIPNRYTAVYPYADYIKFDAAATDMDLLPEALKSIHGKKLVAERVELAEVYEAYKTLGFDYFQGYYVGEPVLIEYNRIDPKYLGVVRIYNMLMSGTPIEQVAAKFKHHNELTLQLLQYLNSTSMKNAFPNRSIEEIVVKVGPERLKQWLQLIIFSKTGQTIEDAKSPLSKLTEQRIDVMHCTISALQSEDDNLFERARLLAFLSLMEPVLGVPTQTLLDNVPVDQSIEDALLLHSGRLGKIFALALALEKEDDAQIRLLMHELGLEPNILPTLKNMIKI